MMVADPNDTKMAVSWRGLYRLGDDAKAKLRVCSIVDLSTTSVGVEMPGESPDNAIVGQEVVVWVELRATIRNTARGRRGGARAGIEFNDLSGEAAEELETLRFFGSRW